MISRKFANEKGSSKTRIEYVFGKGHEHKCDLVEFVGGNVFSSTQDELIEELDAPCYLRKAATGKDSGKCHMHYMLSLAPGESLHANEWRKILFKTMTALGYTEDHKYFGELHKNSDHQHMHIIANRISMRDHKLVSESNDYEILMNVCREIEQEYGLQVVPMPHETFGANLTREEVEASQKSGKLAWKHKLIARVATALERTQSHGGNMIDFVAHLNKAQVSVDLTIGNSGNPTGISYKFDGKSISGRSLKRSRFTWQNLIKRESIKYDESMLQELQKAAGTRDAEPAQTGPHPTIYKGLYVTTQKQKIKTKKFAIVVQVDKLRRASISRLLEPTYTRENKFFYVFAEREKLSRDLLRLKIMNDNAVNMTEAALKLVESILAIFKCTIEIDHSPDEEDGILYSLKSNNQKRNPASKLYLAGPTI